MRRDRTRNRQLVDIRWVAWRAQGGLISRRHRDWALAGQANRDQHGEAAASGEAQVGSDRICATNGRCRGRDGSRSAGVIGGVTIIGELIVKRQFICLALALAAASVGSAASADGGGT